MFETIQVTVVTINYDVVQIEQLGALKLCMRRWLF